MSSSKVTPVHFRTLDDEAPVPLWMALDKQHVAPAPFLEGHSDQDAESSHEPPHSHHHEVSVPRHVRCPSMLPSAPLDHAPLAAGGLRPTLISLSPTAGGAKAIPVEPVDSPEVMAEKRAFSAALLDIATLRARALREAEQGLTDLSVRVAKAILERELATDPSLHLELVRATLSAFGDSHRSKLRASPRTYDAILEVHGSAVIEFEGVLVTITRDPALEGLGCIVEGEVNLVDGRIEERLASVWRAFRGENQRKASEESR